jgi:hypothetical protein
MDQETAPMVATHTEPAREPAAEYQSVRNRDKSLTEIEDDIARTRVRLAATIADLERELAPQRVVETTTQSLRNALESGPGPFRQQVWAYAIPLALIATGLGWLFLLRRRNYPVAVPSTAGEIPAAAIAADEMLVPASSLAEMAGPAEPVSLVDENTGR